MRRTAMRWRAATGAAAVGLLIGALAGSGCQAAPSRAAADTAAEIEVARPPDPFDPFPIVEVRSVRFGGRLVGYLKVKVDTRSADDVRYFEIYDDRFLVRGFQTEGGKTYRRRRTASKGYTYDMLGTYTRENALRLLLGGKVDQEVILLPVEGARSLAEASQGKKGATR